MNGTPVIDSSIVTYIELGLVIFTAFTYVINSLLQGLVYRRLGIAWWQAWVPVWSNFKLLEVGGINGWFTLLGVFAIWDAYQSYMSVAKTLDYLHNLSAQDLLTQDNFGAVITTSMAENIISSVGSIGSLILGWLLLVASYRLAQGFGYNAKWMSVAYAFVLPIYLAVIAFGDKKFYVNNVKYGKRSKPWTPPGAPSQPKLATDLPMPKLPDEVTPAATEQPAAPAAINWEFPGTNSGKATFKDL